jgi:hypothetical protein
MSLGPQQMPPQGAKALIGGLLGGRRGGPEVSAVLDETQPGSASIELFNEGSDTAIDLQYAAEEPGGGLAARAVGDIAPGATFSSPLPEGLDAAARVRLVWWCRDAKGRVRAWSDDGRTRRLRSARAASAETAFRALYP